MPYCDDYYTVTEEDHPVYHNKSNCPDGERIRPENKRYGRDGRPPCKECPKVN